MTLLSNVDLHMN